MKKSLIPLIIIIVGVLVICGLVVYYFTVGTTDEELPPAPVEEIYTGPEIVKKDDDTISINGEDYYKIELKYSRDDGEMTLEELAAAYIDPITVSVGVKETISYMPEDGDTEAIEDNEVEITGENTEEHSKAYLVTVTLNPDSYETSEILDTFEIRTINESGEYETIGTKVDEYSISFYVNGELDLSLYEAVYGSTGFEYIVENSLDYIGITDSE